MTIVIIGLTITSSWGNGHATTYRGLVKALHARGHTVTFLECDKPWYAAHRDLPDPPFGRTSLYADTADLRTRFESDVRTADLVIVGSYVPDGVAVGQWVTSTAAGVTAFYDIDTPVTLAKLARGDFEYLTPQLIARYRLYLSFTGGPTLSRLEREFGSPRAVAFYCSVDPALYSPDDSVRVDYDMGYLGTYSPDRQPTLDRLLVDPAIEWPDGRFAVAGPQYPADFSWPANVDRVEHLPPAEHRRFYCRQRFTLNVTRADMIAAGHSPSVRLFEAAACGTTIVSDRWAGIDDVLVPGDEVLIADTTDDALRYLRGLDPAAARQVGAAARRKVLSAHTADHRAAELEGHAADAARA